jgi:oligopeptide/dipeptide ABC transporter ATP-binding protein
MLLEATDLSVEYRSLDEVNRAVNRVDLQLNPGEIVGMVGESGCGKSTLALALLGLTRPHARITSGSVKFEGHELSDSGSHQWGTVRGRDIGLVTQDPRSSLNPTMRIGKQLSLVVRTHTPMREAAARAAVLDALRRVGINDPERRYDAYPYELSGGMAQRVVLAMATVCRPRVIVADEPTSRLDVTIQAQILDDMARTVREIGSTLLLITQDLGIVANYADRLYVMYAGEVVEAADTNTFFRDPAHPSSVSLLHTQSDQQQLATKLIGGSSDGRHLPTGCWLRDRCPFADAAAGCADVHPFLTDVGGDHFARCHRHEIVREVAKAAEAR